MRERDLEEIVAKYKGLLHYVIRGILKDQQDAEDCFSEVCTLIWKIFDRFDSSKSSITTWLTVIARNAALNMLKSQTRRESGLDRSEHSLDSVAIKETPETKVLKEEELSQLKVAISSLGSLDRDIFYRKYYYLQSTIVMAAELSMTERAVEGRLYRIRKQIKKRMGVSLDE